MKFDLKNRPRTEWKDRGFGDHFKQIQAYEKWFEGFEKELQHIVGFTEFGAGRLSLAKEILGE